MSAGKTRPKYILIATPVMSSLTSIGMSTRASEEGDPSAFVTAPTFADFSFIATYGTSDRVPLLGALVHLHLATLDFRQSGWSKRQRTTKLHVTMRNETRNRQESES